jgi:hypothetical protein
MIQRWELYHSAMSAWMVEKADGPYVKYADLPYQRIDLVLEPSLTTKANAEQFVIDTQEFMQKAITEQVAAMQWIPCSERMPELMSVNAGKVGAESEWVLVHYAGNSEPRVRVLKLIKLASGALHWADDEISWPLGSHDTHWMPLPEPPK